MTDLIKARLYWLGDLLSREERKGLNAALCAIVDLPSAQPTFYGYDIRHLELIASVLQEENLPQEKVAEALTDVGRIVEMITDEFEEQLRKAIRHE